MKKTELLSLIIAVFYGVSFISFVVCPTLADGVYFSQFEIFYPLVADSNWKYVILVIVGGFVFLGYKGMTVEGVPHMGLVFLFLTSILVSYLFFLASTFYVSICFEKIITGHIGYHDKMYYVPLWLIFFASSMRTFIKMGKK